VFAAIGCTEKEVTIIGAVPIAVVSLQSSAAAGGLPIPVLYIFILDRLRG